ncbi:MAG: bacterial regulatory helix-turn-helix, AraC family protein [Gemmatimonadetes bacterium]|nr:bacterial regulatory helix-turn-helix, AraC family protein [Gemmatimonadota bacterium]
MTHPQPESIQYLAFPRPGIDAMRAHTARSYPRHSHDQYGIGVIDHGGHSSWSGRGQVEAGPGQMICCNPGEVTDGRAGGGAPRTWRMLYLEPEPMRELCADVTESAGAEFTFQAPVFSCHRSRELFDRAFAHAHRATDTPHAMLGETAMLELMAQLQLHSTSRRDRASANVASIRRAKQRIDADPALPVTLAELASEEGLSRYQLLRAFARELGVTPHAYILQRRIELARQLLCARCGIAEAAVRAGFHDQPHLTRCFVRQFGVTPGRYLSRLG